MGALEAWLKELETTHKPSSRKQAGLAWGRLLRQCGKSALEVRREDIEGHVRWMEAEGYSPATTANAVGYLAKFYEWCKIEINPAAGVKRPNMERFREAKLLSREEAGRLLNTVQQDPSELGKRGYAFLLSRLRLGVPLRSLQQLKWGQIEQDEGGAWVRWRAGVERARLPADAWEAMLRWLRASGRLEGMRDGKYIFTPLAYPGKEETGSKAEDWVEGRALSNDCILADLKLYGRLAGIGEEKLTLMALRRTATRLRLDEGEGMEGMMDFLDSQEEKRAAKYRLGRLPHLPEEAPGGEDAEPREVGVPKRTAKPFKPGEGVVHGLYAHSQPTEAVAAVLREDIQGIEEQIIGMRMLGRGLQERMDRVGCRKEAVRLGQAYTLAARRLADLIRVERQLKENKDPWAEEFLEMLDRMALEQGEEPVSEQVRADALGEAADLSTTSRRLVEEIAATRYVLRNTFALAMETEEDEEYVHLVEIYSIACNRLLGLLRVGLGDGDQLAVYLREQLEKAIRAMNEDLGLAEKLKGKG